MWGNGSKSDIFQQEKKKAVLGIPPKYPIARYALRGKKKEVLFKFGKCWNTIRGNKKQWIHMHGVYICRIYM